MQHAAAVEKAVSKIEGVESCSVNLLTNSMIVEGSATEDKIVEIVKKAGYGAAKIVTDNIMENRQTNAGTFAIDDAMLRDEETPVLKKRLIWSVGFLLILMYFSMGHMMWGWPVPGYFAENHLALGLLQMLLASIIMVINQKFFISGFRGLINLSPNMDTLVALGASAAYGYSIFALFAMTSAQTVGDAAGVIEYMHEFYFETAAMILTLITVGKMLESRSKGKTTNALKSLMKLTPKTAAVIRDGKEIEVAIEQVAKGEIFVVRPGDNIPVDGVVKEGVSAVNESTLTGESIPVDKGPGDIVSAATINQSGYLKCEAVRVGEDTTLYKIIQMVSDAAATKAPIAKAADKVSGIFVPAVIAIGAVTIAVWLMSGQTLGYALARGISVLVISCPCALGLATPVAIMVGSGKGARNGILFKTAVSLEETGKVKTVVLDKTGTITRGEPEVTDIIPAKGVNKSELLELAYSLEVKSEHPLAKAIVERAEEYGVKAAEVDDFIALPGNGLSAKHEACVLSGGNSRFIKNQADIPDYIKVTAEKLASDGKTTMFFAKDEILLGIIAVADIIKEDSQQAVKELRDMGIKVVMLTGDNRQTAEAVGEQVGVDEIIAEVLPDGKEQVIRKYKRFGKTAMIGDGINDAPALTAADTGIAIGAGTDVAVDAADIVLMNSSLRDAVAAIRLSRGTLRNIHQNLFWAFIYNIIGIPLAAGVWIPLLGLQLNPMFGAAAMSLSSVCVVTNALRLNLLNIKPLETGEDAADRQSAGSKVSLPGDILTGEDKIENMEDKKMEKIMKIEGMMCQHCEARVKKTLEDLDGVENAAVDHEKDQAVVTLKDNVGDDILKKAVEDQDYTVIEIL